MVEYVGVSSNKTVKDTIYVEVSSDKLWCWQVTSVYHKEAI